MPLRRPVHGDGDGPGPRGRPGPGRVVPGRRDAPPLGLLLEVPQPLLSDERRLAHPIDAAQGRGVSGSGTEVVGGLQLSQGAVGTRRRRHVEFGAREGSGRSRREGDGLLEGVRHAGWKSERTGRRNRAKERRTSLQDTTSQEAVVLVRTPYVRRPRVQACSKVQRWDGDIRRWLLFTWVSCASSCSNEVGVLSLWAGTLPTETPT